MGKKIKINKKQLDEIVGTDIDYLNNGDYNEYNGNSEVSTTSKIPSSDENGEPITTDEFAKWTAPRGYFGARTLHYLPVREEFINTLYNNKTLQEKIGTIIANKIKNILK